MTVEDAPEVSSSPENRSHGTKNGDSDQNGTPKVPSSSDPQAELEGHLGWLLARAWDGPRTPTE